MKRIELHRIGCVWAKTELIPFLSSGENFPCENQFLVNVQPGYRHLSKLQCFLLEDYELNISSLEKVCTVLIRVYVLAPAAICRQRIV